MIWSKGYLNDNYSKKGTEPPSKEHEIIRMIETIDDVIFIRNGSGYRHKYNVNDLNIFANNIHKLTKPCILITSDGDRPVPSSYNDDVCNKILNHLNIKKWYTQNYDRSIIHPKLNYYPIGFDLHTSKWLISGSI